MLFAGHYVNISANLFSILSPKYYGSINYIFIQKLEIYSTVQNIHKQNKNKGSIPELQTVQNDTLFYIVSVIWNYKSKLQSCTAKQDWKTS